MKKLYALAILFMASQTLFASEAEGSKQAEINPAKATLSYSETPQQKLERERATQKYVLREEERRRQLKKVAQKVQQELPSPAEEEEE